MKVSLFQPGCAVAAVLLSLSPAHAQPIEEWSVALERVMMSPLRFADIDGNGSQDLLVATMGPIGDAYSGGTVRALAADGSTLPGWPVAIASPITGAALGVGDLDGDGTIEIVAAAWNFVHVWDADGLSRPGWPKSIGTSQTASPALADIDGDGHLEIIVPAGSLMHAWNDDGTSVPGWPRSTSESLQAPSIADIDGDGLPEVIAGTWRPQFPDTVPFELHAWNGDGTSVVGFPIGGLGSVRGAVSIGDVDADGAPEIVTRAGDTLHVFDGAGQEEPGWPVTPGGPIRNATAALGDLDDDGDLEIVIGGFDLYAYHHDGTPVAGWPATTNATGNINTSPVIASIDGDASAPEVVVKIANQIVAFHADGTPVRGFPIDLSDDSQSATFAPAPVIGDVDGDGDVEYAFASLSSTIRFYDEAGPAGTDLDWPMMQHDVRNTSLHGGADVDVPGDTNGDGIVDVLDLVAVVLAWGACPAPPGACPADVNGDGVVDVADLVMVILNWS